MLGLCSAEAPEGSSLEDQRVFLHVKSAGYEGSNELFVMREEFVRFCMSLRQLEQTPRGEARRAAMFPNELGLVMRAANSRGGL